MTKGIIFLTDSAQWDAAVALLLGTPAPVTPAPTPTPAPTITASPDGSFVLTPGLPDGSQSGQLVDALGDKGWLVYSAVAEFPYAVIDGGDGSGADWMGVDKGIIYATNSVAKSVVAWQNGGWQTATLPSPWPNAAAIPSPPPPAPPAGSVVTGASPVTATATGMATAIAAAAAGATVALSAGIYTETCAISQPITINGAGIGTTTLNCQGITPNQQKAVLVPSVPGITIGNLTITGSAITDANGGNAAGVRDSANGIGFALNTVEIFGCQDGVLTFASTIAITGSHIHDNGNATSSAGTHNIYCGGGTLTLTNSIVEHCTHEHEVKSRATATTITGCTLRTGGLGNCIDIPDCGTLTVSNTTLVLGAAPSAADQDSVVIHFGEESATNLSAGAAMVLTNVIIDATALPGVAPLIVVGSFAPAATLSLTGCTYLGNTAPAFQGITPAQITGAFTQAA